tara:strand:- start:1067 stop:1219 length:153 start_codon:yes stop_codon:yes gene_type:complete
MNKETVRTIKQSRDIALDLWKAGDKKDIGLHQIVRNLIDVLTTNEDEEEK